MTGMVVGGLFNAMAFAGAGLLFKHLDGNGYQEETERHNLAMEKLSRDKEQWNEEYIKQKDKAAQLRQRLSDANLNINDTNAALDALSATFRREPQLNDYYTPSSEMQGYQTIVEGAMGLGIGWGGYKLYKRYT